MAAADSRAEGLSAAVELLRAGALVAIPTETVYGLAADAGNPRAVATIFAAKGRPRFNPLIVHAESLPAAEAIAEFGPDALALAEAFWPGPLTLVLPLRRRSGIADLVTAGLNSVAIRVPAHPVARDLLLAFGGPLAAPSANRSGHVSPTDAAHVEADLGDALAVILDAGPSAVGVESTIIGLTELRPTLLRPGGIPCAAIEAVLGRSLAASPGGHASAPIAPGMLASHYAPSVPVRLEATELREGEAVLAFGPPLRGAVATVNLSPGRDLVEAAARLFAALRELEAIGAPIAAMPIPHEGLGEAINDRLRRAAAPRG